MRIKLIVLFMFWLSAVAYPALAVQSDSVEVDSSNVEEHKDDYCIVAIGGMGITTGSTFYPWESEFNIGPAAGVGFEIPISKPHKFGIQVYTHYWIGKDKETSNYFELDEYLKVSDNYYSAFSTSIIFKYYFWEKNSFFRLSLDLGFYIHNTVEEHRAIESGVTLYFNLTDKCFLNVSRILNWEMLNLSQSRYGNFTGPNLLMLNFGYKIRM